MVECAQGKQLVGIQMDSSRCLEMIEMRQVKSIVEYPRTSRKVKDQMAGIAWTNRELEKNPLIQTQMIQRFASRTHCLNEKYWPVVGQIQFCCQTCGEGNRVDHHTYCAAYQNGRWTRTNNELGNQWLS